MDDSVLYKVYGIKKEGKKELIGSYSEPLDAHDAAMRWTRLFQSMQIEKVSKRSKLFD